MALIDEDRDRVLRALVAMSNSMLEITRESSERLLRDLEDTNSSFPATQEFLKSHGLTNVRQLDKTGKAELMAHLKNTLRLVSN